MGKMPTLDWLQIQPDDVFLAHLATLDRCGAWAWAWACWPRMHPAGAAHAHACCATSRGPSPWCLGAPWGVEPETPLNPSEPL